MTTQDEEDQDVITVQPSRPSPPRLITRPDPIVPPPPPVPPSERSSSGAAATARTPTSTTRSASHLQLTPTFPSPAYSQSQLDVRRQMELMMAAAPQSEALSHGFDRPVYPSGRTKRGKRARQRAGEREIQRQEQEGGLKESFYKGLSWCLGFD